jgi:hypothetical protein
MAVVAEKIESFEKRGRLLALQVRCVWTVLSGPLLESLSGKR